MRKLINSSITALACSLLPSLALAHTPLFDCFDEGNNTIVCEAGFSDGASAEGIDIRLTNAQGKVLAQDKIGADGSVSFERPSEEFSVIFTAGEGHIITVFGDDIY